MASRAQIEPALDSDVRYVAANMRDSDAREFLAVSPARDRAELTARLLDVYGGHPLAICARMDGEPVCIGAGVEGRPNVVTLLFFATAKFDRIAVPVTRFITRRLFPRYRANGVHRIEAASIEGYDEAHRWIEMLGLKREAVLRGYGKDGETFHMFSWVRDDVCATGA